MEHEHEHTHTHSHDGAEHMHTHSHPHCHDHGDSHNHTHNDATGENETTALLHYMLKHNVQHCEEMKELAGKLAGEAQHQLLHAIEDFEASNDHLKKAVELMEA